MGETANRRPWDVRAARFAHDTTMTPDAIDPAAVDSFIARWATVDVTERANYQLFALDLCELLGVQKPSPDSKADGGNAYVFERNVTPASAIEARRSDALLAALCTGAGDGDGDKTRTFQ